MGVGLQAFRRLQGWRFLAGKGQEDGTEGREREGREGEMEGQLTLNPRP